MPLGRATVRIEVGVLIWIQALAITLGFMVIAWATMYFLARRLPPGLARDLIALLPDCTTLMWRLRRDPAVPTRAKIAVVFAALWVASPIDLAPEFLPVIGPLDDVIVVALCLRYAGRRVPREVILTAWPGQPRVIERLLGPAS